jgi:hypothetical protein
MPWANINTAAPFTPIRFALALDRSCEPDRAEQHERGEEEHEQAESIRA